MVIICLSMTTTWLVVHYTVLKELSISSSFIVWFALLLCWLQVKCICFVGRRGVLETSKCVCVCVWLKFSHVSRFSCLLWCWSFDGVERFSLELKFVYCRCWRVWQKYDRQTDEVSAEILQQFLYHFQQLILFSHVLVYVCYEAHEGFEHALVFIFVSHISASRAMLCLVARSLNVSDTCFFLYSLVSILTL